MCLTLAVGMDSIISSSVPFTMKPLVDSDLRQVRAAQGWLELGDYLSADAELDEITPELRAHPDVLKVRWGVYSDGIRCAMLPFCDRVVRVPRTKYLPSRNRGIP